MNNQKERAISLLALNGFIVAFCAEPVLGTLTQGLTENPETIDARVLWALFTGSVGLLGAYMTLARADDALPKNHIFLGWQLVALVGPATYFVNLVLLPLLASTFPITSEWLGFTSPQSR